MKNISVNKEYIESNKILLEEIKALLQTFYFHQIYKYHDHYENSFFPFNEFRNTHYAESFKSQENFNKFVVEQTKNYLKSSYSDFFTDFEHNTTNNHNHFSQTLTKYSTLPFFEHQFSTSISLFGFYSGNTYSPFLKLIAEQSSKLTNEHLESLGVEAKLFVSSFEEHYNTFKISNELHVFNCEDHITPSVIYHEASEHFKFSMLTLFNLGLKINNHLRTQENSEKIFEQVFIAYNPSLVSSFIHNLSSETANLRINNPHKWLSFQSNKQNELDDSNNDGKLKISQKIKTITTF